MGLKKIKELQNNAEKIQTDKDLLQQLLLKERELKKYHKEV